MQYWILDGNMNVIKCILCSGMQLKMAFDIWHNLLYLPWYQAAYVQALYWLTLWMALKTTWHYSMKTVCFQYVAFRGIFLTLDAWLRLSHYERLSAVWSVFIAQKICQQLQWPARNFTCHTDDLMHTWGEKPLYVCHRWHFSCSRSVQAAASSKNKQWLPVNMNTGFPYLCNSPLQCINHIWLEF